MKSLIFFEGKLHRGSWDWAQRQQLSKSGRFMLCVQLLLVSSTTVTTSSARCGCCRGNGNAEADEDMVEANISKDNKLKKEKKDKKDKKEKKEKKKHKKDKRDKRAADKDGGSSDVEALDKKQIEDELRQKALLSARKSDSLDE